LVIIKNLQIYLKKQLEKEFKKVFQEKKLIEKIKIIDDYKILDIDSLKCFTSDDRPIDKIKSFCLKDFEEKNEKIEEKDEKKKIKEENSFAFEDNELEFFDNLLSGTYEKNLIGGILSKIQKGIKLNSNKKNEDIILCSYDSIDFHNIKQIIILNNGKIIFLKKKKLKEDFFSIFVQSVSNIVKKEFKNEKTNLDLKSLKIEMGKNKDSIPQFTSKFLYDENIEKSIYEWFDQNIRAQLENNETKQLNQILTIFNGTGDGKTRLLLEIYKFLRKKNNSKIIQIYIPFASYFNQSESNPNLLILIKSFNFNINLLAGYLIFCFYLNVNPMEFLEKIILKSSFLNFLNIFSIYNVFDFIFDDNNNNKTENKIIKSVILLLIDEFQLIFKNLKLFWKSFMNEIFSVIHYQKNPKGFILICCNGTLPKEIQFFEPTMYSKRNLTTTKFNEEKILIAFLNHFKDKRIVTAIFSNEKLKNFIFLDGANPKILFDFIIPKITDLIFSDKKNFYEIIENIKLQFERIDSLLKLMEENFFSAFPIGDLENQINSDKLLQLLILCGLDWNIYLNEKSHKKTIDNIENLLLKGNLYQNEKNQLSLKQFHFKKIFNSIKQEEGIKFEKFIIDNSFKCKIQFFKLLEKTEIDLKELLPEDTIFLNNKIKNYKICIKEEFSDNEIKNGNEIFFLENIEINNTNKTNEKNNENNKNNENKTKEEKKFIFNFENFKNTKNYFNHFEKENQTLIDSLGNLSLVNNQDKILSLFIQIKNSISHLDDFKPIKWYERKIKLDNDEICWTSYIENKLKETNFIPIFLFISLFYNFEQTNENKFKNLIIMENKAFQNFSPNLRSIIKFHIDKFIITKSEKNEKYIKKNKNFEGIKDIIIENEIEKNKRGFFFLKNEKYEKNKKKEKEIKIKEFASFYMFEKLKKFCYFFLKHENIFISYILPKNQVFFSFQGNKVNYSNYFAGYNENNKTWEKKDFNKFEIILNLFFVLDKEGKKFYFNYLKNNGECIFLPKEDPNFEKQTLVLFLKDNTKYFLKGIIKEKLENGNYQIEIINEEKKIEEEEKKIEEEEKKIEEEEKKIETNEVVNVNFINICKFYDVSKNEKKVFDLYLILKQGKF
jgi:hypothetical protein